MSAQLRATVCQRWEELQHRVPDGAYGSAEGAPAKEGSLRPLQEARLVAKTPAGLFFQEYGLRQHRIYFLTGCGEVQALDKLSWVSSTVMPARYQSPQIQFACWVLAGVLWLPWIRGCDEKILGATPRHPATLRIKQARRILCTVGYYLCAKVSPRPV